MEPFDIATVNTATVTFRLEKDDNVDFKFEAGRFGSPERVEAWVVRKRLRGGTASETTRLTEDGKNPLRSPVSQVDRFCMALVGTDGPAPNTLRLESLTVHP